MTMSEKEEPTFEQALAQLESTVEKMESDTLPLEELLTRYEEGLKLVKFCSEKLDGAEKRIEIIAREAGGKPKLVEFDPTSRQSGDPAPPAAPSAKEDVRLF